ncbi:MAG TPA: nucleoside hydrolase [Acidimicrobiales bacterium]|nr:nucleoside hydrolase [Acidimicrobiales bacterium]
MPVRVAFDSDGGVDDAAALWWACQSPDVEVVAVTACAGNVGAGRAAANLATVLAAAGHGGVPVAVGADEPVGPVPALRRAAAIHGTDGLGDAGIEDAAFVAADVPAPSFLARSTDGLTVVATGPLTNLARAIAIDPDWPRRVAGLVVMGGSARAGGNARPAAEANFAHDPTAAAIVAEAPWPAPPLMVGLDVTLQATLTDAEFDLLEERRTPAAAFLSGPLRFYRRRGSTFTPTGDCPCHDLVAMIAAAHEGFVTGPELTMAVDTGGGAAWGASIVDFRELAFARAGVDPDELGPARDVAGGRWRIGLDVDVARFRAEVRALFGG